MSLIVHDCPDCGHNDTDHVAGMADGKNTCSYAWCPCRRNRRDLAAAGEPRVVRSYDARTGALKPEIVVPGTAFPPTGTNTIRTCPCDKCRALYDTLGGVAS